MILQVGAGTGLLYLLRWFWWRVTAWCEIVAMSSSFLISAVFFVLTRRGFSIGADQQLLLTVIATTICWVITAYVGPQTDRQTLIDFYKKVKTLWTGLEENSRGRQGSPIPKRPPGRKPTISRSRCSGG